MSDSPVDPGASTINSPGAGGRGRGGRRGGGRGDGRGGGRGGRDRGGGRATHPNRPKTPKIFRGSTDGMQGNVFQGYDESPDKQQFTKTLEALSTYMSTHMDFPKDVASICKRMKRDIIQEPSDLTEEELKSATKKLIWKTRVQSFVRRIEAQEKNFESIFAIIWGQ